MLAQLLGDWLGYGTTASKKTIPHAHQIYSKRVCTVLNIREIRVSRIRYHREGTGRGCKVRDAGFQTRRSSIDVKRGGPPLPPRRKKGPPRKVFQAKRRGHGRSPLIGRWGKFGLLEPGGGGRKCPT